MLKDGENLLEQGGVENDLGIMVPVPRKWQSSQNTYSKVSLYYRRRTNYTCKFKFIWIIDGKPNRRSWWLMSLDSFGEIGGPGGFDNKGSI